MTTPRALILCPGWAVLELELRHRTNMCTDREDLLMNGFRSSYLPLEWF